MAATRAILLIDHGSRLPEANDTLRCMADLVRNVGADEIIVRYAHMELASPTVAEGVEACVAAGAREIIAQPYMLAPGRHAGEDIPMLVRDAVARFEGLVVHVALPLGVHPKLAEVVLDRCGVGVKGG